ncbi:MAG: DUF177 domain-containing protein [Paludibacter sp.]|nr:DUF177 domain-containing protein [Paludibacter sp.]
MNNDVEIEQGNVKVIVVAQKKIQNFVLKISLEGYVIVPCDRCLDDMQQLISYSETLTVKFGENFEEDANTVIIPESDGYIDLACFFYQMIVVNIPIKHVHQSGTCNITMEKQLEKYSVQSLDRQDIISCGEKNDKKIDPRWEKLKEIK